MVFFQGRKVVVVSAADTHVGHSIALHLTRKYTEFKEVRVLTQSVHEERVSDLRTYGCTVMKVDTTSTTTVIERTVFQDAHWFIYVPSVHRDRIHEAKLLLEAAKSAAVQSVLFISHLGAEAGHKIMGEFREIEAKVKEWENHVIFRTHWFLQNLSMWAKEIREKHKLRLPFRSGHRFAFLDINDLCRCTSTIVTIHEEQTLRVHYKQVYTLTGSESLTMEEFTDRLSVTVQSKTKINYEEVARVEVENLIRSLKEDAEYVKFHTERAAESVKLAAERVKLAAERKEESIKESVQKTFTEIGNRIRHLLPVYSTAETDVTVQTTCDFFEWARTTEDVEIRTNDVKTITGVEAEHCEVYFREHREEFVSVRA